MKININESGISFNRDSGSNNAVLDESILKEIEERLKNINDKVEYSDKIPTDEDIVIFLGRPVTKLRPLTSINFSSSLG